AHGQIWRVPAFHFSCQTRRLTLNWENDGSAWLRPDALHEMTIVPCIVAVLEACNLTPIRKTGPIATSRRGLDCISAPRQNWMKPITARRRAMGLQASINNTQIDRDGRIYNRNGELHSWWAGPMACYSATHRPADSLRQSNFRCDF